MPRDVLVGIPTYCGATDLLPSCLKAIRGRSGSAVSYRLVVVDDSGRNEHRKVTKLVADHYGADYLENPANLGITASWNKLARSGDEPLIMLVNDDIVVTPGWLEAFSYFVKENPNAGAVGLGFYFIKKEDISPLLSSPTATVTPRHHSTKERLKPEEYQRDGNEQPGCMMCAPGCAFGFTREMFELVGGFDSRTRQFYNESWLGTALAEKGHPSYVIPHPTLWHVWSATFARAPELRGGEQMGIDRRAYVEHFGGDFDYTDPKFMSKIPFHSVKWMSPSGPREAVIGGQYSPRQESP